MNLMSFVIVILLCVLTVAIWRLARPLLKIAEGLQQMSEQADALRAAISRSVAEQTQTRGVVASLIGALTAMATALREQAGLSDLPELTAALTAAADGLDTAQADAAAALTANPLPGEVVVDPGNPGAGDTTSGTVEDTTGAGGDPAADDTGNGDGDPAEA